ncbi:hypothetical protein [Capnocytophaga canis]|uniref:hypothetical protein n=1 Tax=Capnocytophaga canis TaxID=1848903 RepID=UPI0037D781D5
MDRKSVLILILFILVGCNNPNNPAFYYPVTFLGKNYYRADEFGMARPIKPHFRLTNPEPYQLKKGDNVDTTAIYINKDKYFNHKGVPSVIFLRFFGDGHCAFGSLYKDSLQYNAPPSEWGAGYYKMLNSNEFQLEIFQAHSKVVANYENSRGIIKGDTIYIFSHMYEKDKTPVIPKNYKKWTREKENLECHMYIKQKVDTLTGTPDW